MKRNEKNLLDEVKHQLWRMGKRAVDMTKIPGVKYDLLVEDKIRVCIGRGDEKECDVIASVNSDGKKIYAYAHGEHANEWKTPTEIFGPKK